MSSLTTGIILLSLIFSFHFSDATSQKPEWAGVWGIWGGENYSNMKYPWYVGTMVHTTWAEIQPVKDQFNFEKLDKIMEKAVGNGLYIGLMVYIAPDFTPEWIYTELQVPEVVAENGQTHPWYFNEDFQASYKTMVEKVADHIDNYPSHIREKIVIVQAIVAKSGDPQPWNSEPVDARFEIPKWWFHEGWLEYTRKMYTVYYDAYKDKKPEIIVLLKGMGNNEEWIRENLPNAGRKAFSPGQGYHLGSESRYFFQYDNVKKGIYGVREEFDRAVLDNTDWFNAAPVWNVYWTGLWSLTYGMDIWNQRTQVLNNPDPYIQAFEFFTKYAGCKDASTSKGAWVAFRDDIDGADMERFPEAIYGSFNDGGNPVRNSNIALAFAEYGARQDDPSSAINDPLSVVLRQKGFNDVQSNVWRGNYGMHLKQINANKSSQGYWRVGSGNEPFGRFARGFNNRDNKNFIFLDINDKFFKGSPLNAEYPVKLNITWFDEGDGKWELRYDAIDNTNKTGIAVTNSNTGKWKTVTLSLADAYFGNRGPSESDLSLVNVDNKDNIFHMVEIIRD